MSHHPPFSDQLWELYKKLRSHFGSAKPWWPGTPFEIAVTANLVQQCDWSAAWAAVKRLESAGVHSMGTLAESSHAEILQRLRGVSFAVTKSQRLVRFAQQILKSGCETIVDFVYLDENVEESRRRLLAVDGIGNETADCVLLYAGGRPTFVVDAITRRICSRLNLGPPGVADRGAFWSGPYDAIRDTFLDHINSKLNSYAEFAWPDTVPLRIAVLRDYHAQFVELGKHHCLKRNPRCKDQGKPGWKDYEFCIGHCTDGGCRACPLSDDCEFLVQ